VPSVPVLKGPRALALHLRKLLHECGVHGPWIVRKVSSVEKCGGEWCIDVHLTNTDNGRTKWTIVAVRPPEEIRIATGTDEETRQIVHGMICDCLAASGMRDRVFCGDR